jgi:hypothetical protein
MMSRTIAYTVLAVFMVTTNVVYASNSTFKFAGFGTLGVSHSSEHHGDYVLDGTIPDGVGLSHDWFAGNDSRIGIQASGSISPKIEGVLQVISEYQYDKSYHLEIEWANIKYQIAPNLNIRAGRIALPTFLSSDTRKVGYSYAWIHPPIDLYRQLALTNSDGVDATIHSYVGDATNRIKLIYGRNVADRPNSVSTAKNLWGVFDTLQYDAITLHVGYQEREASSMNRTTGIAGAWVRNTDLSIGASWDVGNWFATSEWIQRKSNTRKVAM